MKMMRGSRGWVIIYARLTFTILIQWAIRERGVDGWWRSLHNRWADVGSGLRWGVIGVFTGVHGRMNDSLDHQFMSLK